MAESKPSDIGEKENVPVINSPRLTRNTIQTIEKDETSGIPLNTPWTFWLDKASYGSSATEYEASLRNLYTVNTVQGFWGVFNNIPDVKRLTTRYSYHLMRYTRKPMWEEEEFKNGGIWRFKCNKLYTSHVWKELLLAAIGEQFCGCMAPGDEMSGLSVSIRDREDVIQIWNQKSNLANQSTILKRVQELLPDVKFLAIFYKEFNTGESHEKGATGSRHR